MREKHESAHNQVVSPSSPISKEGLIAVVLTMSNNTHRLIWFLQILHLVISQTNVDSGYIQQQQRSEDARQQEGESPAMTRRTSKLFQVSQRSRSDDRSADALIAVRISVVKHAEIVKENGIPSLCNTHAVAICAILTFFFFAISSTLLTTILFPSVVPYTGVILFTCKFN